VQEITTRQKRPLTGRGFALALLVMAAPLFAGQTNRPPENGPGITYMHDEVPEVPWSIHVVKVARYRTDFRLETALGQSNRLGMSLLTEQVKWLERDGARPMAAVNGDFYKSASKYPGDPEGLQISQGELVSGPSSTRSCFWLDATGRPHHTNVQSAFMAKLNDGTVIPFGLNEERAKDEAVLFTSANGNSTRTSGGVELVLARGTSTNWLPLRAGETYTATVQEVRNSGDSALTSRTMILSVGPDIAARLAGVKVGDPLTLSTATTPNVKGSPVAIGGGPALVRAGKTMSFSGLQPRHPRVAMGWNKTHFFLVEVDGRQKISAGMTFPELAAYMAKIGCEEAINLDGGGSATIWVYGNVMNNPSEGRPRPAANALVVMRKSQAD
jgi:hypothetical protein